jgi:glyoxylase-like metal-dependent hydrolase (beta-lactamase superfamily II)/8-oxo-dGTP pyrophosphatase MutT (NUDIX family)
VTEPPVGPVLAATVVLLRSRPAGMDVLLTKRPSSMAFAPGMHVFPGGRVDREDAEPRLLERSVIGAAAAAKAIGGDLAPKVALAAHVAAIRELFEEAGVLLGDLGTDQQRLPPSVAGQARSALVGGEATFGAIATDLGLRLRTDLLVPLSRWVTPPILPRRFDARFFAAELPAGARVSFEGDEVAGHAWMTPAAALDGMAARAIEMWVPTSATLQQLEHATSFAEIRERLTPGPQAAIDLEELTPEITRIVMPAGGGVAGQPVCAYLIGRRRHVLIDPGDPTGPALARAMAAAVARGGSIAAVALTQVTPDHAAGAQAIAEILRVPVLAGPGGGRRLPYTVAELGDLDRLEACDVPLLAVHAPGPSPEHLAFLVGEPGRIISIVAGDLDGRRGLRSILPPIDEPSAETSRERLRTLAPGARWLPGHPA